MISGWQHRRVRHGFESTPHEVEEDEGNEANEGERGAALLLFLRATLRRERDIWVCPVSKHFRESFLGKKSWWCEQVHISK
jgi:hypothetical protein